jgi:diguanylate cyclase (GGDEF)-like protein
MSLAYVNVDHQEHLVTHCRTLQLGALWTFAAPAVATLRALAANREALILPDLATAEASSIVGNHFQSFRGLAGMPIGPGTEQVGLLCVLDVEPLSLRAAELDALADLARGLGEDLERQAGAWATPAAQGQGLMQLEALERLAVTDPLTGLSNRRGGDQDIAAEISRAKRQRTPLSCILLDVDNFKTVNDTYGHQAGDFLLREIGTLLRSTLRAYDILVRWGGDEFLIVLPGVVLDGARGLAERVRVAAQALPLPGLGSFTISAGVATIDNTYDFESVLARADRQLYQAKGSGRNCVA